MRLPLCSRLIATTFASSLLVGCTVGPNYARPQMPAPPQYRFVEGTAAESIADAPWFQVFDDPTLQQLIRESKQSPPLLCMTCLGA